MINPTNADLQRFINMRMGGFHARSIFIGVIRKRFVSAGLKNIITEANLVGQGSVDSTLPGEMYNRVVQVLKTIYEALQRLKLDVCENWLQISGKGQHLDDYLESGEFTSLTNERQPGHMVTAADTSEALFQFWKEYENEMWCYKFGPMAVFWNSFWKWWKFYWIT